MTTDSPPNRFPGLLSPREVADRLGCSRNHLRSLQIPSVRLGKLVRYRPADIDAVINRGQKEAGK